ncbi:membrane peptidoglycan carboxypeptidase [Actinomadura luteofluorescens]|uniref:Membrane peptidoglycan carboxypeptidase n=1 Tax=Actinomadura luteofluorescens TaxID=46163 RepID=A0A7Y9ELT2_9ACTN|nr:transglycosylase domain-containing protein [Actinomadura luteofluorescens]NYD50128.1 membrane peptidoglycan carboxypeptidase [Actinomadura luteofluorescens]
MSDSEKIPEREERSGTGQADRHETEAGAPAGTDGPATATLTADTESAAGETAGDAEFADEGDISRNEDKDREESGDAGERPESRAADNTVVADDPTTSPDTAADSPAPASDTEEVITSSELPAPTGAPTSNGASPTGDATATDNPAVPSEAPASNGVTSTDDATAAGEAAAVNGAAASNGASQADEATATDGAGSTGDTTTPGDTTTTGEAAATGEGGAANDGGASGDGVVAGGGAASDEVGAANEVGASGDATAVDGVDGAATGDTKSMPAASKRDSTQRGSRPGGPPPGSGPGRGGRGGGKGPGKPRSRRSRFLRRALFLILGFIGFCIVAFGVAYLFTPVPSAQEQAIAQGPTFYYSDGKTQIAKTGMNRDAVKLDKIPESTRAAVIAAENRSFYNDPGVSVQGTARALWSTATGKQLQGGSTITQQMVRNYYGGIGKDRSVTRKLKEIMVSLKVGREKDKDWILEQYLNTIYFGRDAYGVQAAAHAYYNKDVSKLTPAEGAYLAAAIQQPSNFSDPTGPRRAYSEQRWRAIVGNMVRDGALTSSEAASLTFPAPAKEKITDVLKGQRGYMVNVAKKELTERRGYSEDEINRSGLKITTTFDKRLMDAMKQAVAANAPNGMSKKIRTGAVSVDPKTGQVLAFYGGRGYLEEALSSAFGDWAQAGSGFKPIALAAALDDGKTLSTSYDGSSPQYFHGTPIRNDSNENFGTVNLVTATEHSINTAYINLGQDIGNKKIVAMAEKMGIPASQMKPEQRDAATFPLGIVSLHPVQQAGVYSTFASEGVHRTPFVVKTVTDNENHKRTFTEKGERAFSQQVARDATYAMQKVVQGGTGTGAQLPDGRDVAGKTGTTDAGRAIWFNGFIPQMATTVSMFRSDGKPLNIPGYGAYGGQLPAQMWRSYMSEAVNIKGYDPESFGEPSMTPGGGWGGPTQDAPPTGPQPPDTGGPVEPPPSTQRPEIPTPPTDLPTIIPPQQPGGGGDGGNGDGGTGGDPGGDPGGGTGDGPLGTGG